MWHFIFDIIHKNYASLFSPSAGPGYPGFPFPPQAPFIPQGRQNVGPTDKQAQSGASTSGQQAQSGASTSDQQAQSGASTSDQQAQSGASTSDQQAQSGMSGAQAPENVNALFSMPPLSSRDGEPEGGNSAVNDSAMPPPTSKERPSFEQDSLEGYQNVGELRQRRLERFDSTPASMSLSSRPRTDENDETHPQEN